jgi:hypothetical protein
MKRLNFAVIVLSLIAFKPALGDEVTKCFERAWAHTENGGLGLHRGGAIELCQGTTNANQVLRCFERAWAHPANGGGFCERVFEQVGRCNPRPSEVVMA